MAEVKKEWKPFPTTPGFWWMKSTNTSLQPVHVLSLSRHTAAFTNDQEFIIMTMTGQKGFYLTELKQIEKAIHGIEGSFQFQKIKPAD